MRFITSAYRVDLDIAQKITMLSCQFFFFFPEETTVLQ